MNKESIMDRKQQQEEDKKFPIHHYQCTDPLEVSPNDIRRGGIIFALVVIGFAGLVIYMTMNSGKFNNSLGCLSVRYQFSALRDKATEYREGNFTLKQHSQFQTQIAKAIKGNRQAKCGYDEDAFRRDVSI